MTEILKRLQKKVGEQSIKWGFNADTTITDILHAFTEMEQSKTFAAFARHLCQLCAHREGEKCARCALRKA